MNATATKWNLHRWLALAGVAAVALTSSACVVTTEAPPTPRREVEPTLPPATQGTFVLRWTIDGRTDPNECTKSVSSELEVSLTDHRTGREIGAWRQNCQVFSLSVRLNPGTYDGSATLLDAAGRPRTTSVTIDPFVVRDNETIDIPVDFPGNSFL